MLLPLLMNLGFAGGGVAAPEIPPTPPVPMLEETAREGGRSYYEVDEKGQLQKRAKEEKDILLFIKVFLKWR